MGRDGASASAVNGNEENVDFEYDTGPGARQPDFGLSFLLSVDPEEVTELPSLSFVFIEQ